MIFRRALEASRKGTSSASRVFSVQIHAALAGAKELAPILAAHDMTHTQREGGSPNPPSVSSLICVKRNRGSEIKLISNRLSNTPTVPKSQYSEFSALLQAQRRQLLVEARAKIAASDEGQAFLSQSKITDDDGLADAIAEMEVTMAIRESQELQEVEAALARIADGSYGTCFDCGDGISQARLKANPACRRCLPCQEKYERAHSPMHRA